MNNKFYKELLKFISKEREAFDTLVNADNNLGLNVTSEDIINYLEFAGEESNLKSPILGNVIITEGDVLSILKIIFDITNYEGEFTIFINEDNVGTITYIISRANILYKEYGLNVMVKIDYSKNYNQYLNKLITIIGSETFVNTASLDFANPNKIIM